MTQKTENWSKNWKSSKNPSKQRKYRDNAPLHIKDKLVSANVSEELREELGTKTIKVRTGDRARIMRGDNSGSEGIINDINREETVIYINGITNERNDGSTQQKALKPSNLQIVALNVEDADRLDKFEVDDYDSIQVDEEELEEALEEDEEQEMMEQMQSGESGAHEQFEEDEESADQEETDQTEEETEKQQVEETETDYEQIVQGTIKETKEKLKDLNQPNYQTALEAEKNNKNRKTLKQWIKSQEEQEE